MSPAWEALASRARGLMAHLLTDERMRRLERSAGLAELTHELRESPYGAFLPPPRETTPVSLDVGITRSLAARTATLARWAGPGGGALAALFLEQDTHNVRDVLRGVAGGMAPEQRLAGVIPTPSLDRKALERLARAESVGAVAATLAAWGHPLGSALLAEAGDAHVDLFRLEAALDRGFADAATRAAKSAGRPVRRFVAESLDVRNTLAALVLAGARHEEEPSDLFVDGGVLLDRDAFERAVETGDARLAADALRDASAGTYLAAALDETPLTTAAVASRVLAGRIERLEADRRIDPVSALPVLLFLLRLRNEAVRVRRALWFAALAGGVGA